MHLTDGSPALEVDDETDCDPGPVFVAEACAVVRDPYRGRRAWQPRALVLGPRASLEWPWTRWAVAAEAVALLVAGCTVAPLLVVVFSGALGV